MSILPENKVHKPKSTPRNFFIFGKTMSGKSYLAERFPNSLIFNTDDNSESGIRPAIQLRNQRNAKGKLTQSIIDQLDEYLLALQTENNTYETIVIDVIEDVVFMLEQAICMENDVKALSDIPYGKGYAMFNAALIGLVTELKQLNMNVVYISRAVTTGEGITEHEIPALKEKYYNVVNGNCDLVIQTQRIGKRYIRRVTDRRKHYQRDQIKDPKILNILDNISGVFDKPIKTTKEEQNKIVEKIDEEKGDH
ncbi:AAA family ATPase [Lentilactobacillus hilgardii]|uniref:AAA family ATPase n=1 Tax=Lentilactobacillus hilgardii TaxID=1588 RepID=UPI00390C6047